MRVLPLLWNDQVLWSMSAFVVYWFRDGHLVSKNGFNMTRLVGPFCEGHPALLPYSYRVSPNPLNILSILRLIQTCMCALSEQ